MNGRAWCPIVLAAAAAGCAPEHAPVLGPDASLAVRPAAAVVSPRRLTDPPDTAQARLTYPNEPPGHVLIAASSMDSRFPWGPSEVPGSVGTWWQYPADDPRTRIHAEEDFPGAPHFNRTTFEPGHRPGRAPVNWGAWNGDGSQRGEEQGRIYFSMRLRLAPGGRVPVWESQRIGTKLGFFGVGRCEGAHNEMYPMLEGGMRVAFTLRMGQQNVRSEMWYQNRHRAPVMRVGRWHHWEIEMALNDIGRPNGLLRWWVDGRLIMEHRNVVYRTAEDPCGFLAYKWNPTWGGTGGPARMRRGHIDISDIRISGAALPER